MNFGPDIFPLIFVYMMIYAYAFALAWSGSKMSFVLPAVLWVVEVFTNLFFPPSMPKMSQFLDLLTGETLKLAALAALLYFIGIPAFKALSAKKAKSHNRTQPQKS
jgi:hypothetical protein